MTFHVVIITAIVKIEEKEENERKKMDGTGEKKMMTIVLRVILTLVVVVFFFLCRTTPLHYINSSILFFCQHMRMLHVAKKIAKTLRQTLHRNPESPTNHQNFRKI